MKVAMKKSTKPAVKKPMKAEKKKTFFHVLGEHQKAPYKHVLLVGDANGTLWHGIFIGKVDMLLKGKPPPLYIISPSSGDTVATDFHVIGTSDGGTLNATITNLNDGTTFQGTPPNQTGLTYDFEFDATANHPGDYSVSVTNGDGLDSIRVQ